MVAPPARPGAWVGTSKKRRRDPGLAPSFGTYTFQGEDTIQPESSTLSPEALAALDAGLESARRHPPVYIGSFARYADDC